jgi:hypothetical protein
MDLGKNNPLANFKNLFVVYGVIAVVVLVALVAGVFGKDSAGLTSAISLLDYAGSHLRLIPENARPHRRQQCQNG